MAYKKEKNVEPEKKIDVTASDVFVVNANHYRPYIETFVQNPVNFTQQKMGTFLGLFYITDFSEDSAHIVNFLTSEAKKEYFANTKRSVSTSFESALHRINCALAEVAKHGNVGWLGKIDGAVCVIDETALHFSVTGDARVLLLRENTLTDISDGLASDEALEHPLKTFVDIASGDIEKDDIVIITTPELLSLFSMDDLAKYASRFGADEFVRFLNTALINECDVAAAFVLHAKEVVAKQSALTPEQAPATTDDAQELTENFFSEKTFEKEVISPQVGSQLADEIKDAGDNYTDKRTGHIYVDGDEHAPVEQSALSPALDKAHDFYDDFRYGAKSRMRSWGQSSKRFFVTTGKSIAIVVRDTARSIGSRRRDRSDVIEELHNEMEAPVARGTQEKNLNHYAAQNNNHPRSDAIKSFFEATGESTKHAAGDGKRIVARAWDAFMRSIKTVYHGDAGAIRKLFANILARTLSNTLVNTLARVKTIFSTPLLRDKRVLIVAGVLLLLAIPLVLRPLFIGGENNAEQIEEPSVVETPVEPVIAATINDGRALVSEENVLQHVAVVDETTVLGISGETVWMITVENGESETFTLPDNETVAHTTFMDELNLLFLYTRTGKLYAFSTVDQKFTEGTPNDFPKSASAIASFSTFLYALDPETNQLYRYPRAESATGFGGRVAWFGDGEAPNTKNFHAMGINENVYLAENNDISVYLRGKKIDASFALDGLAVDLFYTNENSENTAVLNKEDGRVIRFTKTSERVDDFTHPDFANALSFAIDEEQNKLYLVTYKGLTVFKL